MIKLTVLYGHPTDVAAFEAYYTKTHLPKAAKMIGFEKVEYTKFLGALDGTIADYHRMAEFWFSDQDALQKTLESPAGQTTADDLSNFASGGAKLLLGSVEK